MPSVYEQAEILTALLLIGGADEFPDYRNILDRAISRVTGTDQLHLKLPALFSNETNVPWIDLPTVLSACVETGLVEWKRGDMRILAITLPLTHAQEIAFNHGGIELFMMLGAKLASSIDVECHVFLD